jgi:putative peptidoglycan lipid II flippase
MCYAPGLLGYSAVKIASPSFYALRDSRTPVTISGLSVLTNIVLNLTLVRVLGYRGLALGTALSALLNAGILLWLLRGRLGGIDGGRVGTALLKITVASIAMAVAAVEAHGALRATWPGGGLLHHAVQLLGAIVAGMAVLALAARLLRIDEFETAVARIAERITGRRHP